ncbi:MAG TPA: hypothetical protein VFE47_18160 [Tepidisphaeraceae bacterium]|jgi:hypothetical protein|nr:hypothetical protein [Tepidisphaeraceae bacterium]
MSGTQVTCTSCGREYDLPVDYVQQYAGCEAPCEACGATFIVPEGSPVDQAQNVLEDPASSNPPLSYQSPTPAFGIKRTLFAAWRDGNNVVVVRGGAMPPKCVVCASEGPGLSKRFTLPWIAPRRGRGALFMSAKWLLADRIVFHAQYCIKHSKRAAIVEPCSMILLVVGVFVLLTGLVSISDPRTVHRACWMAGIGLFILVAALLLYRTAGLHLKVVHCDARHAWIGGCGVPFLKSLQTIKAANAASAVRGAARLEQIEDDEAT